MKLPLLYDTERMIYVVEDAEWGDFPEPHIYRARRIWRHNCKIGGYMKLNPRVQQCPHCEEARPPMKPPTKSDDESDRLEKLSYGIED